MLTDDQKAEAFDLMVQYEMSTCDDGKQVWVIHDCDDMDGTEFPHNGTFKSKAKATYDAIMAAYDKLTQDDETESEECGNCAGTGEGMVDGSRCTCCGGSGVKRAKVEDDFPEPEEKEWLDY